MNYNLVKSLICSLFEDTFDLRRAGGSVDEPPHNKAMLAVFSAEDSDIAMLLWAPSNYVGVYVARMPRIFADEWIDGITGWQRASYHDSCWREDGVGDVMKGLADLNVGTFAGMGPAVKVFQMKLPHQSEFRRLASDPAGRIQKDFFTKNKFAQGESE